MSNASITSSVTFPFNKSSTTFSELKLPGSGVLGSVVDGGLASPRSRALLVIPFNNSLLSFLAVFNNHLPPGSCSSTFKRLPLKLVVTLAKSLKAL